MQAIHTKYLGPTDSKGARVSARCATGSTVIGWDHALTDEANHAAAARQLQLKIAATQHRDDPAWLVPLVCGCLPDGSYAHILKA